MNQIQKFEINKETHLLEIILATNKIVITDLENIVMGLALAKLNIVSPAILDSYDIGEFKDRQPANISLKEIEVSSISVFQNSDILHFLTKFPSHKLVCKKITVYPDQHHNKILDFENGNLVAECPGRNLNIGHCKTTVGATFCRKLKNGTCAQQLVSGAIAHCSTLPGHLDPVTVVDHGTLILNEANMTITDDQGRDQNRLSLPFFHELSLSNVHHIGTLREKLTMGSFLSYSFALLASFLLCSTVGSATTV